MCFKSPFQSLIWKSFAFTKGKIRLSNQERAESCSETSFGTWFVLLWTGPAFCHLAVKCIVTWHQLLILRGIMYCVKMVYRIIYMYHYFGCNYYFLFTFFAIWRHHGLIPITIELMHCVKMTISTGLYNTSLICTLVLFALLVFLSCERPCGVIAIHRGFMYCVKGMIIIYAGLCCTNSACYPPQTIFLNSWIGKLHLSGWLQKFVSIPSCQIGLESCSAMHVVQPRLYSWYISMYDWM